MKSDVQERIPTAKEGEESSGEPYVIGNFAQRKQLAWPLFLYVQQVFDKERCLARKS